jgi:hypothetical protein
MTQSLLSSWAYQFSDFSKYEDKEEEYAENARRDFLSTLRKEPRPTTEAMQRGIDFENLVTLLLDGKTYGNPEWQKWEQSATAIAEAVRGGQLQCAAKKDVTVNGLDFLLYGRLDCLKGGTIYDIKFTGSYEYGKFAGSVQHPMYFKIVPEAKQFIYLVTDGRDVFTELYYPNDCQPIEDEIAEFIAWLEVNDLLNEYKAHWEARE